MMSLLFVHDPFEKPTHCPVHVTPASSIEGVKQATHRPPVAPEHPRVLEAHGDRRVDPYYWLREKQNPEVLAYLEAENAYTEAVMAPAADLQATLYREIVGRIQET